ncbi:histidine phosphatase family protein [bacterium]|nr:histidine phosphatase family protein [bacterium]
MLEIWWVRHGSTEWNDNKRWQGHSDVRLNENGRRQARFLAKKLAGIQFTEVWSSDLERSLETALLALPNISLNDIKKDRRLRELNMGIAEGKTWEELTPLQQQDIVAWWDDPYNLYFPGTEENLRTASERLREWQQALPEEGKIIVFSHGGLIRAALWDITGVPDRSRRWSMELGNTGIMRIRYQNNYPTLVSFNDISHLPDYLNLSEAQKPPGEN